MILMNTCLNILLKNSGPMFAQGFGERFRASMCDSNSSFIVEENSELTHFESKTPVDGQMISPELSVAISIDPLLTVMRPGFVTCMTREPGSG